MNREDMLARLINQVSAPAGVSPETESNSAPPPQANAADIVMLRALVEEASELGAERALRRIGLSDDDALSDIGELRELLGAWRTAKTSAWRAAVDWFVRGLLALLLIGIAVRLGLPSAFAGAMR